MMAPGGPTLPRPRAWRLPSGVGLAPFGLYVGLFLVLPTLLALVTGLFDGAGNLTLENFTALADPVILRTFANSAWLSLASAAIGAVAGALACYALLGLRPSHPVRVVVDAASGVLAQFGGVMLAFMFIATVGRNSLLTKALANAGIDIYAGGNWLYDFPGLFLPYIYFQIPLMIITFMPALERLRPQWVEATYTLGGTRRDFWRYVGMPLHGAVQRRVARWQQ